VHAIAVNKLYGHGRPATSRSNWISVVRGVDQLPLFGRICGHCIDIRTSEIHLRQLLAAATDSYIRITDAMRRSPAHQVVQLLQINAMKLLHIDSSILGEGSVSRQLTAKLVAAARSKHRDVQVTYRDLVAQPVGHLTGLHLAAAQGVKPESSALQQDVNAGLTDLESFLAADVVIVGAPMYNFAISSQLKAWIDRIAVAGKTFRYTEKGPQGLAGGKKVFIVSSRGGFYSQGTPTAFLDHQETYLKNLFGFLGVTDIEFVRAEGLAAGDDNRTKGLNGANSAIAAAFA